jgi:AmiR/NasT family two-component response regulator
MELEVRARDAVLEHARGVLAERFGVEISTADQILRDCARAQGQGLNELATAVVASCTTDETPLPRRLYTNDGEKSEAA